MNIPHSEEEKEEDFSGVSLHRMEIRRGDSAAAGADAS